MKKLILLIVLISLGLTMSSCKKDEPTPETPTNEPTPTLDKWHTITVESGTGDDLVVDSIRYINQKTGFQQIASNFIPFSYTCSGITNMLHSFNLTTDYIKGDSCTITLYFAPSQGIKIFNVLLLKDGVDVCDGAGGNGTVLNTYSDSITVSKNF